MKVSLYLETDDGKLYTVDPCSGQLSQQLLQSLSLNHTFSDGDYIHSLNDLFQKIERQLGNGSFSASPISATQLEQELHVMQSAIRPLQDDIRFLHEAAVRHDARMASLGTDLITARSQYVTLLEQLKRIDSVEDLRSIVNQQS